MCWYAVTALAQVNFYYTGFEKITSELAQDTIFSWSIGRISVVDPWHFGTDPDLRILTTDLLRIRIRIMQWLTRYQGTFTSVFKDKKSQNGRNQGFSYFVCLLMEGSVYPDPDPDPYK